MIACYRFLISHALSRYRTDLPLIFHVFLLFLFVNIVPYNCALEIYTNYLYLLIQLVDHSHILI